jgi:hypothetical protein
VRLVGSAVRPKVWGELEGTATRLNAASLFFFVFGFCLSNTKEMLASAALDVLFWNQVIKANQFLLFSLGPSFCRFSSGQIFLVLRRTHDQLRMLSAIVPSSEADAIEPSPSSELSLTGKALCRIRSEKIYQLP